MDSFGSDDDGNSTGGILAGDGNNEGSMLFVVSNIIMMFEIRKMLRIPLELSEKEKIENSNIQSHFRSQPLRRAFQFEETQPLSLDHLRGMREAGWSDAMYLLQSNTLDMDASTDEDIQEI